MAISGWSTSNYLQVATAPITGSPMTISGWFYITSAPGAVSNVVNICNSSNTTDRLGFFISTASKAVFNFASTSGGAIQLAGATNVTLNAWNHFACVQRTDSDREIFLNGVSDGTSSTSRTPAGLNQFTIGVRGGSSVNNAHTGRTAEVCVRNLALSASQVLMESRGFSPILIAPQNIKSYHILLNTTLMRNNLYAGHNFTTFGTLTNQSHLRIFRK